LVRKHEVLVTIVADTIIVKPGTLYLVSTPIGNLQDITLRALKVLAQVDIIAAEDTRTSLKLLNHYTIKVPLTSYHDFNKEKVTPALIKRLESAESIAIISDAGTPGVSDPAFYLVREAIRRGINVESIPGATAFVTALTSSGLATDRFVFEGFIPVKKGRQKRLEELRLEPRTIIIYESPNRVVKTLQDIYAVLGNRQVVLARELTKIFEQFVRSSLEELLKTVETLTLKGEFVILVEGCSREIQREIKKKEKVKK